MAALTLILLTYRFLLRQQADQAESYRLQELNRFKSRFYVNIIHEFRTPLALILGLTEKLRPGEQPNLGLINRQGQRILRLVNQLLALSRLESQSLPAEYIQADVIPFLKGIAAAFDSAARQKEITLQLETTVDTLIMDFDPAKMQSILQTAPFQEEVAPDPSPEISGEEPAENEATPLFPTPEAIDQPLALVVEDNPEMAPFVAAILYAQTPAKTSITSPHPPSFTNTVCSSTVSKRRPQIL